MKKITAILLLFISFQSFAQREEYYNTSWFNIGGGGAYKGVVGFELNAAAKLDVLKFFNGKLRLSTHAEVGVGLNGMGLLGMISNAYYVQLRTHNLINDNIGFGISTGYSEHTTYTENINRYWRGWRTFRASVQNSDSWEIYASINLDSPDDFTDALTFEFGVIQYLRINKALFQKK